MPRGGSASAALKRTLTEIEEKGKCIRIPLTVGNDLALLTGFILCAVVGFLGIASLICGDDECSEIEKIQNGTDDRVKITDGVGGLTHGVWVVAALQTLIAFWLGPLMCAHPLNLICCGSHRRQVLAIYSICFVLLFLGHITILIVGLLGNSIDGWPKQTLFSGIFLGFYAAATGIIALILLSSAFLSEWYRRKHIVPKQDLSTIMQYQLAAAGGSNRPMWEIDATEVEFGEKIGEGHFGQCFKAEWREQQVVIKKLKQGVRGKGAEAEFENFKRELEVCIQMRHPRICQFLGASTDHNNMFICLEYLVGGSLLDLLHKKKNGVRMNLDLMQKMQIQTDVASGLAYLHQCKPPIAHRDLSSGNVLLDEHLRAKVADFGLSRKINTRMSKLPGNRFYMAPEVLMGTSEYSIEMDIYSFAIVSWEMYQRKRPFQGYKAYQLMEQVCQNELRPTMPMDPSICAKGLQKLIRSCWHRSPNERPSAKEVITVIEFERQLMTNRRTSSRLASNMSHDMAIANKNPMPNRGGERSLQPHHKYASSGMRPYRDIASGASVISDPSQLSETQFIKYNVEKAEKEMHRVLQTPKGQQVLEGTMRDSGMDRRTTESRLVEKMRIKAREAARREYAARYEQMLA